MPGKYDCRWIFFLMGKKMEILHTSITLGHRICPMTKQPYKSDL